MTVSTETNAARYDGDGATVTFAVPFYFLADTDLSVSVTVTATGVETMKVLATDYTVTGAGDQAGGSVTMNAAPAAGEKLVILRDVAAIQGTDFEENADLPAETLERGFDRLTMLIQQIVEKVARSLLLPTATTLSNVSFPAPEAGKLIRGNAEGDGFENATPQGAGQIVFPIGVAEGGTGSTTAAAARNALELETVSQAEAEAGIATTTRAWTAERVRQAASVGLASPGDLKPAAYSAAPAGWLVCDGSAVSRTTYADLFAAIGATYGTGDGSTTFNVPDLRGRAAVGVGQGDTAEGGGNGTDWSLGAKGGAETHALTEPELASHSHGSGSLVTNSSGSHTHQITVRTGSASNIGIFQSSSAGNTTFENTGSDGNHSHSVSGATASAGSGNSHNNLSPILVVNWFIKT